MPFLKYKPLKLKLTVWLVSHSAPMVTYCATKIIPTCSPVIRQFFDTMIVASIDRVLIMTHQILRRFWKVLETVLSQLKSLKEEHPILKQAFLRSDNAGCYKNGALLLSLPEISALSGIKILRYDFSDPQAGKDICDRVLTVSYF